jgi:ERF superfamily
MSPEPVALARLDPQALLAKAIETGAGIDTLERLVTLAKDIRQVTAREAWYEAMAQFQQTCPAILKSKTAKIVTARGSYSYSYATLEEILGVVQPLLGPLGLSVSWRQKHDPHAVEASCVVAHKLGHQEESGFIAMPYGTDGRMNPAQAVGSALTYARRYSLLAILGLAPEDDDDAEGSAPDSPHEPRARRDPPAEPEPAHREDAPAPVAHRQETAAFFLENEDPERTRLVAECTKIITAQLAAKKLTMKDVRAMKATYLQDENADPSKSDVGLLTELRAYLRSRFER